MLYQQQSFTLPTNTKPMTEVLWRYRLGEITAKEYETITGEKPEELNGKPDN